MVDFNNDAVLGTNRSHILDLVILGRPDEWINTFQKYQLAKFNNASNQTILLNKLKSIACSLEFEMRETLKRKLKLDDKYKKFFQTLYTDESKEQDVLNSFNVINEVLDELEITKIDTRKKVNFLDLEGSNESKGL